MCFSAQASFVASGGLAILGMLSLKKVKRSNAYPFAVVPLLFAFQQACEGIVWLTLADPAYEALNNYAMYGFLFFAFFFWPIWIPYALITVETNTKRRNMLYGLLGIGFGISSALVWAVIQHGVAAEITCSHIKYAVEIPDTFHEWGVWIYTLATVVPFFVSNKRLAWIFGLLLLGSMLITAYAYTAYFTSVWCFFAALLSTAIYWYI